MLTKLESRRELFNPDLSDEELIKLNVEKWLMIFDEELKIKEFKFGANNRDVLKKYPNANWVQKMEGGYKYALVIYSPSVYGDNYIYYVGNSKEECIEHFRNELSDFQDETYLNGKLVEPKDLTINQMLELIDEGDLLGGVNYFVIVDLETNTIDDLV